MTQKIMFVLGTCPEALANAIVHLVGTDYYRL